MNEYELKILQNALNLVKERDAYLRHLCEIYKIANELCEKTDIPEIKKIKRIAFPAFTINVLNNFGKNIDIQKHLSE